MAVPGGPWPRARLPSRAARPRRQPGRGSGLAGPRGGRTGSPRAPRRWPAAIAAPAGPRPAPSRPPRRPRRNRQRSAGRPPATAPGAPPGRRPTPPRRPARAGRHPGRGGCSRGRLPWPRAWRCSALFLAIFDRRSSIWASAAVMPSSRARARADDSLSGTRCSRRACARSGQLPSSRPDSCRSRAMPARSCCRSASLSGPAGCLPSRTAGRDGPGLPSGTPVPFRPSRAGPRPTRAGLTRGATGALWRPGAAAGAAGSWACRALPGHRCGLAARLPPWRAAGCRPAAAVAGGRVPPCPGPAAPWPRAAAGASAAWSWLLAAGGLVPATAGLSPGAVARAGGAAAPRGGAGSCRAGRPCWPGTSRAGGPCKADGACGPGPCETGGFCRAGGRPAALADPAGRTGPAGRDPAKRADSAGRPPPAALADPAG